MFDVQKTTNEIAIDLIETHAPDLVGPTRQQLRLMAAISEALAEAIAFGVKQGVEQTVAVIDDLSDELALPFDKIERLREVITEITTRD